MRPFSKERQGVHSVCGCAADLETAARVNSESKFRNLKGLREPSLVVLLVTRGMGWSYYLETLLDDSLQGYS
jgi:hypothetical protein